MSVSVNKKAPSCKIICVVVLTDEDGASGVSGTGYNTAGDGARGTARQPASVRWWKGAWQGGVGRTDVCPRTHAVTGG